jgi:hypothetical protein
MLKIGSIHPTHPHFSTNIEQKWTDTLTEVEDILQKIVRVYSLVQNPKVVNRTSQ